MNNKLDVFLAAQQAEARRRANATDGPSRTYFEGVVRGLAIARTVLLTGDVGLFAAGSDDFLGGEHQHEA